jgi:hypothetical protein
MNRFRYRRHLVVFPLTSLLAVACAAFRVGVPTTL